MGVIDIDCGVSTLGFLGEIACGVVSLGYFLQQDAFFGVAVVGILVTTAQGLGIGTEQRPSIVGDCFGLARFVVIGKIIGNATLANKLEETFLNDATIRIDRNNRIFYVDNTAE